MLSRKNMFLAVIALGVQSSLLFAGFPPVVQLGAVQDISNLQVLGDYQNGSLGQGLSHGDFNGDGIQDIISGAYKASPDGRTDAGVVYVIWGSHDISGSSILDLANQSTSALEVWGDEFGGQLGSQVGAGDINGDGIDDLIMGAWHKDAPGRFDCGAVYVLLGSPDLSNTDVIDVSNTVSGLVTIFGAEGGQIIFDDDPRFSQITTGGELGSSVDAGDINGDGYDDLLLGAWKESPLDRQQAGANYVILGDADFGVQPLIDLGGPDTAALTFFGQITFDGFGSQLGFDGDVNDIDGDGFDDLLLGARFADADSLQDCGEVYVYWGRENIDQDRTYDLSLHNPGVTVLHGSAELEYAGCRLESGDINDDGYPDILIDAYGARRAHEWYGKAYIVHGGPYLKENDNHQLIESDTVLSVWGEAPGGSFGKPSAGDINGDGIADLLVQGDRQNGDTGKAFIIWGGQELNEYVSINLANPHHEITEILGAYPSGKLGFLSDAADINGDGYEDILYTAHMASPQGRTRSGVLHVIWGMPHEPGMIDFNHFHVRDTTGPSATLQIASTFEISGVVLSEGPIEIGVFTTDDVCAGQGIWNGEELAITVYGDSGDLSEITGFLPGEQYRIRIWIPYSGIESEILPFFADGEGYFQSSGTTVVHKSAVAEPTGIDGGVSNVPAAIALHQNFPNPFNPSTTIPFTMSDAGTVRLAIYNVLGERIDVIADGVYTAGKHEIVWDATDVSSGVYFYRLETAETFQTQRMMLVR